MITHPLIKTFFIFSTLLIYSLVFPAPHDSLTVNVVTYNIQTGGYYQPETPQLIAKFVEDWKVDILGTQELHMTQVKDFEKTLHEFSWFGVGRDNGKTLGETSVIFYRNDKLELLEQSTFWLSETPETPGSKSWNTSDTRIVTWGKFLLKANNKILYVFNTHYDHISDLARSESSKLFRLKTREIAGLNPIIITGDFNCSFGSEPYNILLEENQTDLKIFDSEKISQTKPFGPSGSYNDFSYENPTSKIDFIFVNQFFKTLSCGIINEKPDGEFISDHFPVFSKLQIEFPTAPIMPTLEAIAGDNQVNLSWDDLSEIETYEPFILEENDFQGYKLYRSRDPEMKDAELVPGSWDVPMLRKPLLVCDKIDNVFGYTNYGIIDGYGYYLGGNSGLQHFYNDYDVNNGQTYYYLLTAYDHGINGVGSGFAPNENSFEILVGDDGNVFSHTKNVVIVTPKQPENNTVIPTVISNISESTIGNAEIVAQIFNPQNILDKVTYKLKFDVDTLGSLELNSKYRHPNDLLYVNNGFKIVRNDNDSIVYSEDKSFYTGNNIAYDNIESFYYLNNEEQIITEEFEGIQIKMNYTSRTAEFSSAKSGWEEGNSKIKVLPSINESQYFPWKYEIVFKEESNAYTGLTNKVKGFMDSDGLALGPAVLMLKQDFNFYVINKSFVQEDGNYEKLDLVIYDKDMDGVFNREVDHILVGHCITSANQVLWKGTVFALDFSDIEDDASMPQPGDKYIVDFNRPFLDTDSIQIAVDPEGGIINSIESETIPEEFSLQQNYPNPFNPTTTIKFNIKRSGNYSLKVYNLLGQLVKTIFSDVLNPGVYMEKFNGSSLSSGIYIYSLQGEGEIISRKMIILK